MSVKEEYARTGLVRMLQKDDPDSVRMTAGESLYVSAQSKAYQALTWVGCQREGETEAWFSSNIELF